MYILISLMNTSTGSTVRTNLIWMTNTRELVYSTLLVAGDSIQYNMEIIHIYIRRNQILKFKKKSGKIQFPRAMLSLFFLLLRPVRDNNKKQTWIYPTHFPGYMLETRCKLMAIVCRHAEQRADGAVPGEASLERMNRLWSIRRISSGTIARQQPPYIAQQQHRSSI